MEWIEQLNFEILDVFLQNLFYVQSSLTLLIMFNVLIMLMFHIL